MHTSTFLTAFKSNASGRNALSLLGRDYLVAAQQPKGVLHFWAWHKARMQQNKSCNKSRLSCMQFETGSLLARFCQVVELFV